jgi:hypothetical protein
MRQIERSSKSEFFGLFWRRLGHAMKIQAWSRKDASSMLDFTFHTFCDLF